MPLAAQRKFLDTGVLPQFPGEEREISVGIKVSTTLKQGTVLGELTPVADVQTITMSASSGTFTVTATNAAGVTYTTAALSYTISLALLQAALVALPPIGAGGVVVTGTPGASYVCTFATSLGLVTLLVLGTASLGAGGASIVHTTSGIAAGTYAAYAHGNVDGTQTPKAICEFDVITDSTGNITLGDQTGGGEHGETFTTCPVFVEGTFSCADLTGFAAQTLTDWPGARLIEGTVTAGLMRIG